MQESSIHHVLISQPILVVRGIHYMQMKMAVYVSARMLSFIAIQSHHTCQDQCVHPMIFVAPNTCGCPRGYRGTDCGDRKSCMHSTICEINMNT